MCVASATTQCQLQPSHIYSIDLPIGWGLDGSILEYVHSWVQTTGPQGEGIEGQECPHCHQVWPLRLI